jgi:hypothetical protein
MRIRWGGMVFSKSIYLCLIGCVGLIRCIGFIGLIGSIGFIKYAVMGEPAKLIHTHQ